MPVAQSRLTLGFFVGGVSMREGDVVNREGLDYRAGWVEALRAFGQRLMIEGTRAKRNQVAGLEEASRIARDMHQEMVDKMKGG
jgi:hypothetical protein